MATPSVDHGRAIIVSTQTDEILDDQNIDTTRDHQYRKPTNNVRTMPQYISL